MPVPVDLAGARRDRPDAAVLVVDDRESNLIAITALLAPLGREVVTARSGAEALRRLLERDFAVVLLDVQMPDMDGFETARYIRARPATRAVPIVFVTAISTAREHIFRGYEAGAVDYILKPIDPEILRGKVSVFLELHESHLERRRHAELAAAHEGLSLAQRAGESGVWHVELATGGSHWSPEFAELCGLAGTSSPDPNGWLATVDPRDRGRVEQRLRDVVASGNAWQEDFRIIHPTRGTRWIGSRGRTFRSTASGGSLRGVAVDITDRRLAAERAAQLQQATGALAGALTTDEVLRESVEHGRRIARAHAAAVVRWDAARWVPVAAANGSGMATVDGDEFVDLPAPTVTAWSSVEIQVQTDRTGTHLLLPLPGSEPPVALALRSVAIDDDPPAELRTFAFFAGQAIGRALLHDRARTARARRELLDDIGVALDDLLGLNERMDRFARLLVPKHASACLVEVRPIDGTRTKRLVTASDAAVKHALEAIPVDEGAPYGAGQSPRDLQRLQELPIPSTGIGTGTPFTAVLTARRQSIGALLLVPRAGSPFDPYDESFVQEVADRAALAFDNARLFEHQGYMASTLQRSLLPTELPGLAHVALTARYLSGSALSTAGGDWFEAIDVAPGRVMLAVGDVVGRGTEAAAVMGQLRSAMRAYAMQGLSPAGIVNHLNRFAEGIRGAAVSTVVCAEVSWARQEIRYAAAAHPPPLLSRPNGLSTYLLDGRGPPLGIRPHAYVEARTPMPPGSRLFLYSDGAVERRGESIDHGLQRLARLVSTRQAVSIDEIADAIVADLGDGREAASDDVALLVAQMDTHHPALEIAVPPDPRALAGVRARVRDWVAASRLDRDLGENLLLCAMEALANAIEHGGAPRDQPTTFTLRRADDGQAVEMEIVDRGVWKPPAADAGSRGHGIRVMRHLMDGVTIRPGRGGTSVRMKVSARFVSPTVSLGDVGRIGARDTDHRVDAPIVMEHAAGLTRLRGDVDHEAILAVGSQLMALARAAGTLTLDVSEVTYLGSDGIRVLFELADILGDGGRGLSLISPVGSLVRRVLEFAEIGRVASFVTGDDRPGPGPDQAAAGSHDDNRSTRGQPDSTPPRFVGSP